jgi:predicted NAD/FAD-binding protein
MNDTSVQSIAVLGAGVVGLSTAINIQNLFPRAEVTVIADKFNTFVCFVIFDTI